MRRSVPGETARRRASAILRSRYAYAKQFKRHQRQLRILCSRPGRITLRPKIEGQRLWRRGLHFPLDGPVTAAAAAPRRMEALFLPCPGGGLHRQGRRPTSSVKSYIVINNRRTPAGLFVLYAGRCPIIPRALTPCGPSLTTPRRSRAVLSSGPMSAKIPRPRRKNSRRVFVSGEARRRPSIRRELRRRSAIEPIIGICRLKVTSDTAISRDALEIPPTSSSSTSDTTSAASSWLRVHWCLILTALIAAANNSSKLESVS